MLVPPLAGVCYLGHDRFVHVVGLNVLKFATPAIVEPVTHSASGTMIDGKQPIIPSCDSNPFIII